MIRYLRLLLFMLSLILLIPLFSFASDQTGASQDPQPLEIINITPNGEDVPVGRQITFQFTRPVVPVGRMDRDASEIPISITPEVKGQWRWLNTTTLACMLDKESALTPATRYEITVFPGINAEDGATLKAPVKHSFITERPKVASRWVDDWEAPGTPVLRMTFNQPVTRASVEEHIFIEILGKDQGRVRVTARPLPEKEEAEWPAMQDDVNPSGSTGKSDETDKDKAHPDARRVWRVSPEEELPQGVTVTFKIEPGLESGLGPEKGVEDRTIIEALDTFPAFTFQGIQCRDTDFNEILIGPEQATEMDCLCDPQRSIALLFSSPISDSNIKEHLTIDPPLTNEEIRIGFSFGRRISSASHGRSYVYMVTLSSFKPNQGYHIRSDNQITDRFGRTLETPIDIGLKTDHLTPNYIMPTTVVLEKDADTDMAVSTANLDTMILTYDRLTAKGKYTSLKQELTIPDIADQAIAVPAKVRKMLNNMSGVVQGTVSSTPYVDKSTYRRSFSAQVTPFHVHVKLGPFNTLAWVTDLKTGKPISKARIRLYDEAYERTGPYRNMPEDPEVLAETITDADGIAILPGTEDLIQLAAHSDSTLYNKFLRIDKGKDIALLSMEANSIRADYPWEYSESYIGLEYNHTCAWGTTGQGIYRPGDTVQYKIYVRGNDNETLIPAQKEGYTLIVNNPTGKTVYEAEGITLSDFGACQGEFTLPGTATAGRYVFILKSPSNNPRFKTMEMVVADFIPASFKISTDINGKALQPGDELMLTTKAELHSGGPYNDAETRVTLSLKDSTLTSNDPSAEGFRFDTILPDTPSEQVLDHAKGALDENGLLMTAFNLSDSNILYGTLLLESAVMDDRGKYIASQATAGYSARDRFAGLRITDWVLQKDKPGTVDVIVADAEGETVAGVSVTVTIEHRERKTPEDREDPFKWVEAERHVIESSREPVQVTFTPKASGLYRITASIMDTKGREHSTKVDQYAVGKGAPLWDDNEENTLEIIPEKDGYKVGETARYLIKNPFPGAKALITIERYGVLKHWVQTLDTGTPVIEFKVEKEFIPGYFLSVVVMSGRRDMPFNKEQGDPGKPAFRMGYAVTNVDDPYNELTVEARPEKEGYRPGEKVRVAIHASYRDGAVNEPVELAVAVLDEAVFDLIKGGRTYFDPYKAFYTLNPLEVENYNILMHLVGRQNFIDTESLMGGTEEFTLYEVTVSAAKGSGSLMALYDVERTEIPSSQGDEEPLDLRSDFRFLSYWNPGIITDEHGNADIEFDAPDNLTGWHIIVMAVTPTDRMGLGEGHFAVKKETEIRPVMPNQVTEGDAFQAGFSIMNRTDNTRDLTMTITAKGAIETDEGSDVREITQELTLGPFERSVVFLPIATKGDGKISFTARGGDASDKDGLMHELEVKRMTSLETAAVYGSSTSGQIKESLQFPDNIRTDVGRVGVTLSPSVIGNLEGAFRYLMDYPYICWEQILTKAVMASHFQNLKGYISDELQWEAAEGLPQSMLDQAASYQAPNGGMAYFVPEDRYVDPYLSAYTALAFGWLKKNGYTIPSYVEERLDEYLKTMLDKDEAPDVYSKGMASTVRAVSLAALAEQGKITLDDLMPYQPYVKDMDLFGKAHFLMAAIMVNHTEELRREVFDMLLSHADQTGGKFVFSETFDAGCSRILTSALRTNAAVLSAIIAYAETDEGRAVAQDIPFKVVRYITRTRKQSGRWENTQENVFCMKALIDYSSQYEVEIPDMTVTALMDKESLGRAEFKDLRDEPAELKRPIQTEDPGKKTTVSIDRQGAGRLYYSVGLTYAAKNLRTDPVNAGIDIRREYSVERENKLVLLKNPMEIKKGELVRVDLYVSLPAARNFLVVDDPVPGGLEPVNRDLATSSTVDADKARSDYAAESWWFRFGDWSYYGTSRWSFYHMEMRHHAVRFYSEYLPAGNYHLSYTTQAIAQGRFTVMPTHAEEMYDPDVFGKGSSGILNVTKE